MSQLVSTFVELNAFFKYKEFNTCVGNVAALYTFLNKRCVRDALSYNMRLPIYSKKRAQFLYKHANPQSFKTTFVDGCIFPDMSELDMSARCVDGADAMAIAQWAIGMAGNILKNINGLFNMSVTLDVFKYLVIKYLVTDYVRDIMYNCIKDILRDIMKCINQRNECFIECVDCIQKYIKCRWLLWRVSLNDTTIHPISLVGNKANLSGTLSNMMHRLCYAICVFGDLQMLKRFHGYFRTDYKKGSDNVARNFVDFIIILGEGNTQKYLLSPLKTAKSLGYVYIIQYLYKHGEATEDDVKETRENHKKQLCSQDTKPIGTYPYNLYRAICKRRCLNERTYGLSEFYNVYPS